MLRKHFLQIDGLGIRDRQFSGDDLYILGGQTMVLNRESVRFEAALTDPVSLPDRRVTNRAEAICSLPPTPSGGKASWLVLYDAPDADRKGPYVTANGRRSRSGRLAR